MHAIPGDPIHSVSSASARLLTTDQLGDRERRSKRHQNQPDLVHFHSRSA